MSSKEIMCVVADPHLLAEVEQCAAVLGFSLIDGLMDASLASRWHSADAVVADCQGLDEVSSLALPPRRGVFVVCASTPPWERGVQVGAEDVMVLPARSGDLVEALATQCSRDAVSGGCVAVVSAVGGAGGSTVAAGLALSWARSGRGVVLLDANCVSGADDVLLGVESESGMRWGDMSVHGWENRGIDGRAVAANIPATPEGVGVLSVGRGAPAAVEWNQRGAVVQRVAGAVVREGLSVVVDVSGATWWDAADFTGCDCVFVVVPATLRGLGGAVWWSRVARRGGADPVAVVKYGAVSSVGVKDVESVTSMPVVAEFTSEKKIAKEIEETGLRLCGRSSFARMVSGLREIADGYIKNSMPSLPVDECAMSSAQSRAASMGELAA